MLVLMPSTPALFSQVTSRAFMSFRVRELDILAVQGNFWGGFDSRQLHRERGTLSSAFQFADDRTSTATSTLTS